MPVQVAAVAKEKNRLRQSNKLIISINLTTKSPHKQDDTSIKKHKQQQRPPNEAAANSVRTSRFAKPRLALDVRWQQPSGGRQNGESHPAEVAVCRPWPAGDGGDRPDRNWGYVVAGNKETP